MLNVLHAVSSGSKRASFDWSFRKSVKNCEDPYAQMDVLYMNQQEPTIASHFHSHVQLETLFHRIVFSLHLPLAHGLEMRYKLDR